jgi:hypothetical protein
MATALLQAAFALADAPSADGTDAFTIGNYTFDPYTVSNGADVQGFADVSPLSTAPPLLSLGGGTVDFFGTPLALAPQDFDVYNASGTALGSIKGDESVTNLLGMTNTEFTVAGVTPATGETAADLPAKGSVYDVFNLGHGIANVYTATPGTDGTVTDTLITPLGHIDLSALVGDINAANPLDPAAAFTGLIGNTSAGNSAAFAIGDTTFDPVSSSTGAVDGFTPVDSTASSPPLLNIGGGELLNNTFFVSQNFDVYNGTSSSATDVGTITTGENVTNLLGMTNTELTVTDVTPASADSSAQAADLPATGTVYDVFNLGHGVENVYTATPGTDGTVTDTLITPLGHVDLSALVGDINAANPLNPAAAFTGLIGNTSAGNSDAFAIGDTTFDPVSTNSAAVDGFSPVFSTIGAPPLLNISVGAINLSGFPIRLETQDFDVYNGTSASATDVGSISTNEDVTNLLGMTNTEFTVHSSTAASGDTSAQAAALPADGTVYDVFNLGHGIENVYTATPGTDGTVTDTLITPLGHIDLSSLVSDINAAAPLNPGDAFIPGLDAAAAASVIDPLAFLGL